jgi:pimeloyl-[acyl-carrier protein] methyl ester esterase
VKALTLSGWGQPADALKPLAESIGADELAYIDYLNLPSEKELWAQMELQEADIVIGWSLGGLLAVQAVLKGILDPQMLVLLATPYQFVADMHIGQAMSPQAFGQFEHEFLQNSDRCMRRFQQLIASGDSRESTIFQQIRKDGRTTAYSADWLDWLRRVSLREVELDLLPPTLLFQGLDDRIVDGTQVDYFMERCPRAEIVLMPACGHAPHLHAPKMLSQEIRQFYQDITT